MWAGNTNSTDKLMISRAADTCAKRGITNVHEVQLVAPNAEYLPVSQGMHIVFTSL